MADYDLVRVCGIDLSASAWVEMMTMTPGLRGAFSGRSNSFTQLTGGPSLSGRTTGSRQLSILCQLEEPYQSNYEKLVGHIFGSGLDAGCPDPSSSKIACELVYEVGGENRVLDIAPLSIQPHANNQDADDCIENGWYVLSVELASRLPFSETEYSTAASAIPATVPIAVAGSGSSPRVEYCIEATAQKPTTDGARYRIQKTVINRAPRAWVDRPVCVTFNHAAQVTAVQSLTTGNDVHLLQDGRDIPRESGNWNAAGTKVWGRISLPAARWWTVRDYSAGASTIYMCPSEGQLPEVGQWLACYDTGSGEIEVMQVTARDTKLRSITVDRELRDTTARVQAGDNRLWAVHRAGFLDLIWGNLSSTTPACPVGDRAIVFDLAASDNASWDYGNTYYEGLAAGIVDARKNRGGALHPRALGQYDREHYRGDGDQYWRYIAADNGTPATAFGLEYSLAGAAAGRDIYDRWDLLSPIGICQYDYSWTVANLRYGLTGSPIKIARLSVHHIDGSGNDVIAKELDLDVTAGTGIVSETPAAPAYALSWRIDPFDRNLFSAGTGAALEPAAGAGFTVDDLVLTFCSDQTPVIGGEDTAENIYQIGTPDDPAVLSTDAGQIEIFGIVIPVGGTLCLNALTGEVTDGVTGLAHLTRGRVPLLPPDLDTYPASGTTDVTFTETNGTGLELTVTHRDVFPS